MSRATRRRADAGLFEVAARVQTTPGTKLREAIGGVWGGSWYEATIDDEELTAVVTYTASGSRKDAWASLGGLLEGSGLNGVVLAVEADEAG